MVILISIVHIFVCFVLILVILLQAGKGGGLSDMFSGALTQNQKLFGTETNSFLTKATSTCAIIFLFTCIILGFMTTNRSKSLVEGHRFAPAAPVLPDAAAPVVPASVPTPESAPAPAPDATAGQAPAK